MHSSKLFPSTLLLLLSFHGNALAALHDSGPMGTGASGAPTPDAAVLSAQRLPDLATPAASSPSAATVIRYSAARKMRAHARWAQMKALTKRINTEAKAGRLLSHRADALRAELNAIQERYHFRMELEGGALSKAQDAALKGELEALNREITESVGAAKP
jgi:hypothetical protein